MGLVSIEIGISNMIQLVEEEKKNYTARGKKVVVEELSVINSISKFYSRLVRVFCPFQPLATPACLTDSLAGWLARGGWGARAGIRAQGGVNEKRLVRQRGEMRRKWGET